MKIGQVIRKRRRLLGKTLESVAAQAGTDAAGLSRIERGLQGYPPELLAAIAEALGTSPAELMLEAESDRTSNRAMADVDDEQEMLSEYRKIRGSARGVARLMISEMAKLSQKVSNMNQ